VSQASDTQRVVMAPAAQGAAPSPEPSQDGEAEAPPRLRLVTLERVLAAGLAVTGAGIASGGYASTGWEERSAFQITLGVVICVCSVGTLAKSRAQVISAPTSHAAAAPVKLRARPRITWRPDVSLPATFFAALAAYIALIQLADFLIASIVFGIAYLWTFFRFGIVRSVLSSIAVSGSTYLVFVELLGVPFS
jgi:hypothetical protein